MKNPSKNIVVVLISKNAFGMPVKYKKEVSKEEFEALRENSEIQIDKIYYLPA